MNVFITYQPQDLGSTKTSLTDAWTRAYGREPTGLPQRLDHDVYVVPGTLRIERHAEGCPMAPPIAAPQPSFWGWLAALFD